MFDPYYADLLDSIPSRWRFEARGGWRFAHRPQIDGRVAVWRWPESVEVPASPLLRWENLDHADNATFDAPRGWAEQAVVAVLAGRKPVGGDLVWNEEPGNPVPEALVDHWAGLRADAEAAGLVVDWRLDYGRGGAEQAQWVQVSRPETFGALFDLDGIARAYEQAQAFASARPETRTSTPDFDEVVLPTTSRERILSWCNVPVRDGWTAWGDKQPSYPTTGMALGYPVESTIALVHGWVTIEPGGPEDTLEAWCDRLAEAGYGWAREAVLARRG